MSFIWKDLILTDKEDRMSDKNVAQEPLPLRKQLQCLRKSSLMCWTSLRRSVPHTHYYSLLVQYNTEMSVSLFLQWHTEISRDVTPLVLVQEVLKYRQHATHTNPIVFEDNPLSWWKVHGHHFPTLSRLVRRFLTISTTSCSVERLFSVTGQVDDGRRSSLTSDTMTLLVFIHEVLPLVRKIRVDRIVDTLGNFNSGFN